MVLRDFEFIVVFGLDLRLGGVMFEDVVEEGGVVGGGLRFLLLSWLFFVFGVGGGGEGVFFGFDGFEVWSGVRLG